MIVYRVIARYEDGRDIKCGTYDSRKKAEKRQKYENFVCVALDKSATGFRRVEVVEEEVR